MAKVTIKETINEQGVPGWSVRGEFYPGQPADQLAKSLEIPDGEWEVVLLPPEQKKGMKVTRRPGTDEKPWGY